MQYGALIRATFAAYRTRWQYLVPLAFIGYTALAAFAIFVTLLAGLVGAVSAAFLFAVGSIWIQGLLVRAIDDAENEGDLTIGSRFAAIRPSLNALSLGAIVAGVGVVAGLILLIIPGLVLMMWWALLVPAVVLERKGPLAALGRSRDLVRGHGRLVFNFVIAIALIGGVANRVLEYLASALPASEVVAILAYCVAASVVAPLTALASAILYYELREAQTQPSSQLFDSSVSSSARTGGRVRPALRTAVLTLAVLIALGSYLNGRNGGLDPAEKQELIALHNEIVAVANVARPQSKPQADQALRIAKDANEWAGRHEADPEWEELAAATASFSTLTRRVIMKPRSVRPADFLSAGKRLQTAASATQ